MELSKKEVLLLSDSLVMFRLQQERGIKKVEAEFSDSSLKTNLLTKRKERLENTKALKQKIVRQYRNAKA